jgi:HSP20 family molecular chaperone IbpA
MTNSTIVAVLGACVVVCLAVIAALGYSTWQLHGKVERLEEQKLQNTNSAQTFTPFSRRDFLTQPGLFPGSLLHGDSWLGGFWSGQSPWQGLASPLAEPLSPSIEIEEDAGEYRVTIAVPEGEHVELNTEINGNRLSVTGSVEGRQLNQAAGSSIQSRFSSSFSKTVPLPGPVDQTAIEVTREDGKTIVHLPKQLS